MIKFNTGIIEGKDGAKSTVCTGGSMRQIDREDFIQDIEYNTYPDNDTIMQINYHSDKYVSVSGKRFLTPTVIDAIMAVPADIEGKTLAERILDSLSCGYGSRMTAKDNIDLAVKENRLHALFSGGVSLTDTVHGKRYKTLDKFRAAVYRAVCELGNRVRASLAGRTDDLANFVNVAAARFFESAERSFINAAAESARNPRNYTDGLDGLAGKDAVDAFSNARLVYDAALELVRSRALEAAVKELTDDPCGDADTTAKVIAELRKRGMVVVSRFSFPD